MSQGGCQQPYRNMQNMHQIPQGDPIVCPPEYCVRDQFMPREVPVIHPIVNVNRQHYVDIPRHYFTETTENVMGAPLNVQGGFNPSAGIPFDPRVNPMFGPNVRPPF